MSNKHKRGGLGRGLGALIPTAAPSTSAAPTTPSHPAPFRARPDAAPSRPDVDLPGSTPVDAASAPVATPGDPGTAPSADHELQRADGVSDAPDTDAALAPVPGAEFAELDIASIHANAKQPRQVFDEDALQELTHSIREFGVLQPVVVRPDPAADGAAGYELVMGERRLRAAQAAGLEKIPAIVRSTADDAMLRDALLENIHRAQLNPLEEAAAYQQLLEEFGTTHDELAQRIGRSRPQVSNTIRLLNLPLAVQRRVAAGVLSAGHARALLGLDDHDQQDELAARIVAEGLSVRATEELVTMARRAGDERKPARKAPVRVFTAPAVTELAGTLSDVFDTRVRVDLGRRKGKITVEFASIDDLERIVGLMAPEVRAATRRLRAGGPAAAAPAAAENQADAGTDAAGPARDAAEDPDGAGDQNRP